MGDYGDHIIFVYDPLTITSSNEDDFLKLTDLETFFNEYFLYAYSDKYNGFKYSITHCCYTS